MNSHSIVLEISFPPTMYNSADDVYRYLSFCTKIIKGSIIRCMYGVFQSINDIALYSIN